MRECVYSLAFVKGSCKLIYAKDLLSLHMQKASHEHVKLYFNIIHAKRVPRANVLDIPRKLCRVFDIVAFEVYFSFVKTNKI